MQANELGLFIQPLACEADVNLFNLGFERLHPDSKRVKDRDLTGFFVFRCIYPTGRKGKLVLTVQAEPESKPCSQATPRNQAQLDSQGNLFDGPVPNRFCLHDLLDCRRAFFPLHGISWLDDEATTLGTLMS